MAKKVSASNMNEGYSTVHTVRIPLWPYLVPLLFCLAALPATWGVHRAYATTAASAGWTGVSVTVAAFGALLFTFFVSRPRGVVMQAMATANALLAIVWLIPAVLDGPFTGPKIGFWLLFTLIICFDCALYRIMRQARGDDGSKVLAGEFGELGDAVKQLKGVKFGKPVIEGAKVTTAIEMPPGRSFEEVAAARKSVASLLDIPATAVRTPANPDSERRGEMIAVPVDQLKDEIPDPGLTVGLSIADPIVLGLNEDGTPATITLPGDPKVRRNAVGIMGVVGMSGSGKTELLLRFAKENVTRFDNDLHIVDARKSGQLPEWLKNAAKSETTDAEAAIDLLDFLAQRVDQRSKDLGARGHKEWVKGCGLQFETYIVFEAASFIRDSNIVDLAESVRSAGIAIVLELQRATYDRLPTSARSNITTWVCLGVQKEADAEAALTDEAIEAGAAPWKWANRKPGYFYLQSAGREERLWSSPCRSYIQDDRGRASDVAEALEAIAAARAAGQLPQSAPTPEPYIPPRGGQEVEDDAPATAPPGIDPDNPPDEIEDPFAEPPSPSDMPRIPFGGEVRKMEPGQARVLLLEVIEDARNRNIGHVAPKDFTEFLLHTGLSGGWLQKELKELARPQVGVLKYTSRGVYRLLPQTPVSAGAPA